MPYWLLDQSLKDTSSVRGKRRASVLTTFSDTSHVGASAQMQGIPIETDQLGEAQTCLGREQQQGVIATSEPGRAIGRGKYRLNLGMRQEIQLPLVVTLAWYR
jgi:hypothetical protein